MIQRLQSLQARVTLRAKLRVREALISLLQIVSLPELSKIRKKHHRLSKLPIKARSKERVLVVNKSMSNNKVVLLSLRRAKHLSKLNSANLTRSWILTKSSWSIIWKVVLKLTSVTQSTRVIRSNSWCENHLAITHSWLTQSKSSNLSRRAKAITLTTIWAMSVVKIINKVT